MARQRSGGTFNLRIITGSFDNEFIVHDTLTPVLPRKGERISLRQHPQGATVYEVLDVEHLFDMLGGPGVQDELTGVRVLVKAI